MYYPVKNVPKNTGGGRVPKNLKIFLKKKCFQKTRTVPKWDDRERILLPLERVLDRSEMELSRTYSAGFGTLSLYFGTFSLLSNKLHLWTDS